MKNLIILLGVFIISCNPQPSGKTETHKDGDFTIKTIDSCEYIEYDHGFTDQRVYALTHKGNCKYCLQRGKK